jgi:hypothetical protein
VNAEPVEFELDYFENLPMQPFDVGDNLKIRLGHLDVSACTDLPRNLPQKKRTLETQFNQPLGISGGDFLSK